MNSLAISILHGAANTALLLSQYRTALQPQRSCSLNTARRCKHSFCYLNTARRCSHSALAIPMPHGAAATALLISQYRTALQPQRSCYLNTARRCNHSAFAISIPHGAAATARFLSQTGPRCKSSGEGRNTRPLRGETYKANP